MGTLLKKLESDFITAYKAKEEVRVGVLRMLKTAIKNRQVELKAEPSDDDVLDLIARQLKQRKESIEQFSAANRDDLVAIEEAELVILQEYMPEALSPEEVEALVDATIAELGADGMKDMGRVMGAITSAYKGRVDGKHLSGLVRSKLAG
ncbi:GatB/YqeY domain-containing protein [Desulfovibrio ferrophilus]|uniref:GatB/YqeY family protein n=1 Tax=Desulfovibrio ferrophilus TaxID=241368 RepID=A0A2Z6AXB1_9BACT|nr:GatB/YqeY domain-containing protein [Desulfovibrio ferrophilus]BBD07786.1 GatB/YqeY family protein [Desulfovibrio ferrophilus]